LICAGTVEAVRFLMIDSARGELRMKDIPMTGFISMNDASGRNKVFYKGYSICFRPSNGCESATLPFAGNDNDPALAGLMLGAAAVDPILFEVGGADMVAKVSAIDLDNAKRIWRSEPTFRFRPCGTLRREGASQTILMR
jgi:hypothetical protein